MTEQSNSPAQDAVACTCSQAGFPSSCYNCDAEASDIVNALRKLYSTHPICAQAANYIERKLRDMATPSEPLQCLRCGTVDAFGPAARSPAEGERKFEGDRVTILQDDFESLCADRRELSRLRDTIDLLERNARIQAKLLADTGRERNQARAQVEKLTTALRFYADSKRYEGSNLSPIPDDPDAPEEAAYRWDVTRDHGRIASRALTSTVRKD